uniref:Uncharacterized protein n=1 Tax=Anguilla anguilla TaxID=7936 RepID=A0A0E9R982_ANGAN
MSGAGIHLQLEMFNSVQHLHPGFQRGV